jgi:hypothetical protein
LEDARHWIGLLQYNLSTRKTLLPFPTFKIFFRPILHTAFKCAVPYTYLHAELNKYIVLLDFLYVCILDSLHDTSLSVLYFIEVFFSNMKSAKRTVPLWPPLRCSNPGLFHNSRKHKPLSDALRMYMYIHAF